MTELKPCPFCGTSVTIYRSSDSKYFFADHEKNGKCILLLPVLICGEHTCLQDAIDAWNRRADDGT